MEDLKLELKKRIIAELNLRTTKPEDINDDAPLIGDGLGLDSIDALEITVMLEKEYGIKIEDEATGKKAMQSISALALFIEEERKKQT